MSVSPGAYLKYKKIPPPFKNIYIQLAPLGKHFGGEKGLTVKRRTVRKLKRIVKKIGIVAVSAVHILSVGGMFIGFSSDLEYSDFKSVVTLIGVSMALFFITERILKNSTPYRPK